MLKKKSTSGRLIIQKMKKKDFPFNCVCVCVGWVYKDYKVDEIIIIIKKKHYYILRNIKNKTKKLSIHIYVLADAT